MNVDPIHCEISALPYGRCAALDLLPGGISNVSYVATDRRGKYVVRLTPTSLSTTSIGTAKSPSRVQHTERASHPRSSTLRQA